MKSKTQQSGYLMVMVLVFGAIFLTIVTSFVTFVVTQSRLVDQKFQFEQAGHAAEAGINYFKWNLAHYPNSTTTSYVGVYRDPEGADIGQFEIAVASTTYCGETASLQVTSTGYTYNSPTVQRSITARYARPTVAEYSFIINSNVWVGSDQQIVGPYHTNGGVRMDGTNNSVVTSGQTNWSCTPAFGCTPTTTRDGVFTTTANANPALFDFPSPPVNFAGITVDLSTIQNRAQNSGGLYFGPSTREGYHVIFLSDGRVEVRRVNSKQAEPNGFAWGYYLHVLNGTSLVGTYTIPTSCPVLYFEDQVWLEGTVRGKVTIAAADVDTAGVDRSIILNNNILYANATSGLLAISEYDMTIPLIVPDNMTLNGIFIAQNGKFTRNSYDTDDLPNAWDAYVQRNSLTINGTIVSNGRVGTKWVTVPSGTFVSGFNNRYTTYDRNLMTSPPPYTPETSDVYEFNDWRDSN
jgi:hypothetical protein